MGKTRAAAVASRHLLEACDERFAAVVAFCSLHDRRVSDALGIAWRDLDLEAGTVHLWCGSTYSDGAGERCRRSIGSAWLDGRRRSTRADVSRLVPVRVGASRRSAERRPVRARR